MFEVIPTDSLRQVLSEQCNNPALSDVTIELPQEERKLYAHKLILCSQSEVFRAMLHSNMAEGRSGSITIGASPLAAQAKGREEGGEGKMSYETLLKILQFMYHQPISCSDLDECFAMMAFAHRFMLAPLFAALKEQLRPKVCEENVLEILPFARHHGAADLEEECWRTIDHGAAALLLPSPNPSFFMLEERLLSDLLERDGLSIPEEPLFEAVLLWAKSRLPSPPMLSSFPSSVGGEQWTEQDGSEIKQLQKILEGVLPLIRFPQMNRTFLIGRVKPLRLIPTELYIEALEFIALGPEGGSPGGPSSKRLKRRGGLPLHPPPPLPPPPSSSPFPKHSSSRRPRFSR